MKNELFGVLFIGLGIIYIGHLLKNNFLLPYN